MDKTLVLAALVATLLAEDANRVGTKPSVDKMDEVPDGYSADITEITDESNGDAEEAILRVVIGDSAFLIKIVEEETE